MDLSWWGLQSERILKMSHARLLTDSPRSHHIYRPSKSWLLIEIVLKFSFAKSVYDKAFKCWTCSKEIIIFLHFLWLVQSIPPTCSHRCFGMHYPYNVSLSMLMMKWWSVVMNQLWSDDLLWKLHCGMALNSPVRVVSCPGVVIMQLCVFCFGNCN